MDFKQIQELIKTINKSNIGELCIQEKDFKICIKQKIDTLPENASVAYVQAAPALQNVAAPQIAPTVASPSAPAVENSNYLTIKSPMIGTFYRKPAPEKPNFVAEGDDIKVGDVVCVIEAMKLFNEIESEISGKIVKILV